MQIEFSTAVNLLIAIALGVWAVAGTILGIWIKIGKLEKNLVSKTELKEHEIDCPARKYLRKENKILVLAFILISLFFVTGCSTPLNNAIKSASEKNIKASGYLAAGEIETINTETASPKIKGATGRLEYSSTVVGIDADKITPNYGKFKAIKTKSFFGSEETIIEYEYTAGNEQEAEKARKFLEAKRKEAEQKLTENHKNNEVQE